MVIAAVPAYLGQRSYVAIGVAWLIHSAWDLLHHFYGNPLWHWDEMSSLGCAVMDPVVALWFLAGAPSVFERLRSARGIGGARE